MQCVQQRLTINSWAYLSSMKLPMLNAFKSGRATCDTAKYITYILLINIPGRIIYNITTNQNTKSCCHVCQLYAINDDISILIQHITLLQ